MARQTTFSDIENASRRRTTKRDEFLRRMDEAVPWAALVSVVKPHYFEGRRGRKPVGIERMLRMYFLQLWFNLSDEGVEDAVYDSRAFSEFMGISFGLGDQVPDATTLLKFRRIIESKGVAKEILGCVNVILESESVMMRGGSIVDATIMVASKSRPLAGKRRARERGRCKRERGSARGFSLSSLYQGSRTHGAAMPGVGASGEGSRTHGAPAPGVGASGEGPRSGGRV